MRFKIPIKDKAPWLNFLWLEICFAAMFCTTSYARICIQVLASNAVLRVSIGVDSESWNSSEMFHKISNNILSWHIFHLQHLQTKKDSIPSLQLHCQFNPHPTLFRLRHLSPTSEPILSTFCFSILLTISAPNEQIYTDPPTAYSPPRHSTTTNDPHYHMYRINHGMNIIAT